MLVEEKNSLDHENNFAIPVQQKEEIFVMLIRGADHICTLSEIRFFFFMINVSFMGTNFDTGVTESCTTDLLTVNITVTSNLLKQSL